MHAYAMDRRRAITFSLAALMGAVLGALGLSASAASSVPAVVAGADEEEIRLESTKPVDGAELTRTPPEIVLNFAARLPAINPIVQLQNASRELQSIGQPIAINNRTALRVRVLEPLPAGTYTVTWVLRPQNAKEVAGSFEFTLRAEQTSTDDTATDGDSGAGSGTTGGGGTVRLDTTGIDPPDTSNYSGVLGTLGRALGYIGLAALAGALLLIAVAWADGVEYVLTVRHLWMAWAVGVIGTLLTVATAAADRKDISIARGLIPTEWDELLKSTFGKAVVIRLVAMVGCVWVASRPERVIDPSTKLMALGIPAIALATYGWSRDYLDVSAAAIPAGIAHAVGGAAWFGGAALLTRVVLAGPGDHDLVQAVKGFRAIFLGSVVLVLVSGAVQTSIYLGGLGNMLDSTFGRIFLLKIIVVAAMAFIATANRQYARHRLFKARSLDIRPAARLRQSVRSEVGAGVLVFILAAWLGGTSAPAFVAESAATSSKNMYESTDGTFRAEVKFGRTKVGALVELHFRLFEPESIENGLITFQPKDGKSNGIEVPILGTPAYGFEPSPGGFQFGTSGTWIITITGDGPDGPLPSITREFIVNNADGKAPGSSTSTSAVPTTRETVPDTDSDASSG